jgi:hypothetical protein
LEADIPREDKAAADTAVDHEKHELHETGTSIGHFVCLVCFVVEIQTVGFLCLLRLMWQL